MLKDIQVTLYDIFGYLLPGFIFLAGIAILLWAIFIPSVPILFSAITVNNWIVLAVGAYIAGHMVQAIANFITPHLPSATKLTLSKGEPGSFPEAVINSAKSKANSVLDVDLKEMNANLLYEVCDETIVQFGVTSDRDVYIYREGFYRGLMISFAIFFLCLVARASVPGASLYVAGVIQPVSEYMLIFLAVISLLVTWLSYNRFQRFGGYKVRQAVVGFLLLRAEKTVEAKSKPGHLIVVCGLQGTGKTTIAKKVAEKMRAVLLRTDVIRKELKITGYSEEDKQKVYVEMFSMAKKMLLENKNVVLDATFVKQKNRDQAQQITEEIKADFKVIEVVASDKVVKRRIEKRTGDESEAGFKQYLDSKKLFETIIGSHITIDNSGTTEETDEQLKKYF